jgi:hypothetical protein
MNPFTAPVSGTTFEKELFPSGAQIAVLYSMVHCGNQEQGGQFPGIKDTMRFTFESPTELRQFKEGEAEKPMVIGCKFTRSMNEKAGLRKMIEGMSGKAFATDKEASSYDFRNLLGKACMINVVHELSKDGSKTYANIKSFMPIPKGFPSPMAINPLVSYSPLMHDAEAFAMMPEWLQDEIKLSPEFIAMMEAEMNGPLPTPPVNPLTNERTEVAPISFDEEKKAAAKPKKVVEEPKIDDLPSSFFDGAETLEY